jgi:hypothetical protein
MLISKLLAATMIAGPAEPAESHVRQESDPIAIVATPPRRRPGRGTGGPLRSRGIVGMAVRHRGPTRMRHISK